MGLSLLGSGLVLALGNARYISYTRWAALSTALCCVLLSLLLYQGFDITQAGLQFQENYLWIRAWNVHYGVGVDGISLPLVILTTLTTLVVILATWHSIQQQLASYLAALLSIQAFVLGSFVATDAIFFYICWEAVLIPMMLVIGIWGSQQRAYAALKFFMYTFLGSAPLLIALLYLGCSNGFFDFSIRHFYTLKLNLNEQIGLFSAFLLAFAVKIPLWPTHTWLPDAHTEAPTGGSMILAALMLKLGGYGLLRFILPIVPDACRLFAKPLCGLALVAIIYIGLTALAQRDMKRLVAYSSIAHMGIVVLGIFLLFPILEQFPPKPHVAIMAWQGAMVQMVAHGFSAAALFLVIGILYQRFHSRVISDYSGLAHCLPLVATFFMLFAMSNVGLPGTAGFIGEFLVILSAMQANFWLSVAAASTLILSAAYTLYLYKRLFWGQTNHPAVENIMPVDRFEALSMALLAGFILLLGIWPAPLLQLMQPTLEALLQLSLQSKL